eukprot:9778021-Lingulodinium_polyedra.AAC.1
MSKTGEQRELELNGPGHATPDPGLQSGLASRWQVCLLCDRHTAPAGSTATASSNALLAKTRFQRTT